VVALTVILLIGVAILTLLVVGAAKSPPHSTPPATQTRGTTVPAVGALVVPEHPYGMTVAPNGTLYVIDVAQDQILRLVANDKFRVVAGTGHRGFTGDGGQAIDARINVTQQSGVVVAKSGTIYFADSANNRVREILPDGVIKTVIGDGARALGRRTLPAREASLKRMGVSGLIFGPNGDLYVAAGYVYRLNANGSLQWVVGSSKLPHLSTWRGIYSNPGVQYDFQESSRIAFDGKGNLYMAGGGAFGLYERTASGKLRFLGVFRGDGNAASIAPESNGDVLISYRFGLFQIHPSGTITSILGVGARLNAALRVKGILPHMFIGGDGVAVAPNGTIYVDTNTGNTFTPVTAILKVRPNGAVKIVWRS
jgi:hypothetical protein